MQGFLEQISDGQVSLTLRKQDWSSLDRANFNPFISSLNEADDGEKLELRARYLRFYQYKQLVITFKQSISLTREELDVFEQSIGSKF